MVSRKQKKTLIRIIIAAILFALYFIIPLNNKYFQLAAALIPFIIIGWDVIFKSIRNIAHGKIFDENFLMTVAALGAFISGFVSGSGDYAEGTAVMLFYQTGELFQSIAVGKSRRSIASLMDIRPDSANLEMSDGSITQTDPETVQIGSIIVVKPGERIPIDGIIESGSASIDTSALTGEAAPKDYEAGDNVISGCINLNGLLRVRTTKNFGDSTVSKILDLVENSGSKKSKAENFITKFAKYYTPIVVFSALALALIPSFITGDWGKWVNRALIFLVISCPCALVISVPLSFFGGIGGASRSGILIKGGNYLEALSKVKTIVFDKTGTLTKGTFKVTAIHPEIISEEKLLEYAAYAEVFSNHPIAVSIREAYKKDIDSGKISDYSEISGHGIKCAFEGRQICVGNNKLMDKFGIEWKQCHHTGAIIHIAADGIYGGHIIISDEIKEKSIDTISELKKIGIKKTVMLTGDNEKTGLEISRRLGIDEAHCELLPDEKVDIVENLMDKTSDTGKLAFVGDGINDAPVISRADIGIAMGGSGSDAAIEAADIVLMNDDPSKIVTAISISKRTKKIANQNIVFALTVKILILILGSFGFANMWAAVFADVGVSVIAILNAMRCLKSKIGKAAK